MTTNLLVQRYDRVFSEDDLHTVDIKPDVHTRKVLYRLGIAENDTDIAAVVAARRLNPRFPGALDGPLWWVGRQWCHRISPACEECPMVDRCKYGSRT